MTNNGTFQESCEECNFAGFSNAFRAILLQSFIHLLQLSPRSLIGVHSTAGSTRLIVVAMRRIGATSINRIRISLNVPLVRSHRSLIPFQPANRCISPVTTRLAASVTARSDQRNPAIISPMANQALLKFATNDNSLLTRPHSFRHSKGFRPTLFISSAASLWKVAGPQPARSILRLQNE